MRFRSVWIDVLLVATLIVAGVAIHRTNLSLERFETRAVDAGQVGPLPDGRVLRVLSLGFERLVADLFWLRTVYYIGDPVSDAVGYPAADRLAELVTNIDPYFTTAYVIMNSVLSTLRNTPDDAIALLEKGLRYNDWYWRLHFLQGFNYFFGRSDYKRAADHLKEATQRGGPRYLPLLVARLYAEAGSPDTAIAFIQARLRTAETPKVREDLEARLRDLLITRDLGRINAAIGQFQKERGRLPLDVGSLVRAGYLPEEPLDPEGNRYRVRNGRAEPLLEHDDLRIHRLEGNT
jgi:tetratricopeptide (TPR) repeat protein